MNRTEVGKPDTGGKELRRHFIDEADRRRHDERRRFLRFFIKSFNMTVEDLLVDRLEVRGGRHGATEGGELDLTSFADLEGATRRVHGRDDLDIHNLFPEA